MMAEISEELKFTLRLLIDEEKNKVVFAEACGAFVDVLYNLMTLPMGTLVELLKKHQKSQIGCFSNLYRSVADVSIDDFNTEACKQILLKPGSVWYLHCRSLKLNLNPTDELRFFKCPSFSVCNMCSNFSGSVCRCGELMNQEIELSETLPHAGSSYGISINARSTFIITDDLKVSVDSSGFILKTLNCLGFTDVSKLGERFLDIGPNEILDILKYMFCSKTPLTDTFLKRQSPQDVENIHELLSPYVGATFYQSKLEITLDVIVRKQDMKILYVECGEDFVNLLFTFLAVPLFYFRDINLGCIQNLGCFFKDHCTFVHFPYNCELPYYYKCRTQLSDITTENPPVYYHYRNSNPRQPDYSFTTDPLRTLLYKKDRLVAVTMIDPKIHGRDQSVNGSGFVKRGTWFTVSDDLIITPRSPVSTSICSLKKLQIKVDDLDVQVIKIGQAEVMNLLRASLVTSSSLNTALWKLIVKKPKKET